jgi:hypothetical protein
VDVDRFLLVGSLFLKVNIDYMNQEDKIGKRPLKWGNQCFGGFRDIRGDFS